MHIAYSQSSNASLIALAYAFELTTAQQKPETALWVFFWGSRPHGVVSCWLPRQWCFWCDTCRTRTRTRDPYAVRPHVEPLHHGVTTTLWISHVIAAQMEENFGFHSIHNNNIYLNAQLAIRTPHLAVTITNATITTTTLTFVHVK